MKKKILYYLVLGLITLWGWLGVTYYRTQEYGVSWRTLVGCAVVALVYAVPLWGLYFYSTKTKNALTLTGLLFVLVIGTANVWASGEEFLMRRQFTTPASEALIFQRAYPFSDNTLIFDKDGWFGYD